MRIKTGFVASKKEPEYRFLFAGLEGFEPSDDGVRVRCLTVWR